MSIIIAIIICIVITLIVIIIWCTGSDKTSSNSSYRNFHSINEDRKHEQLGHTKVHRTTIDMKMGRFQDTWVDKKGNKVN